jgi:hypothetical protein
MTLPTAWTTNQDHAPRAYTRGRRRLSIYWSWNYPWEAQRDPAEMDNRFPTMTEIRRAAWPAYEGPEWCATQFLQTIAGTLELFHRSIHDFQRIAQEVTGHAVAIFQRVDQAGHRLPLDERILHDTDTLMIFGLDHLGAQAQACEQEIEALHDWLRREGNCLLLAPHHDIGSTDDLALRQIEYLHHGDALVPRQQRFSGYVRSLMKALDVPVLNSYGLRPALDQESGNAAPLVGFRDLDELGLLTGVTTLNFHPHLPHYEVTDPDAPVYLLAQQPMDLDRPHPFSAAGNTAFNCLLWMPPAGHRAADIILVDCTHFTTLFGASESLRTFWKNLAQMK